VELKLNQILSASSVLILITSCLPLGVAQNASHEEGTRQLWDENLQRLRPPGRKPGLPARISAQPAPEASKAKLADSFVGFTLWQLRPSRPSDNTNTRLMVHEEESGTRDELTPERVDSNHPLPDGAKVRVSLETARAGYLYVVDREQYADGSFSDPWLIFPTTRIRNGQNLVGPGTVIELPDPEDKTPYFRLRRNRARRGGDAAGPQPEQLSEVLTVLVSPKPIEGVQIGRSAQRLSASQFETWQKQWATQTKSLEASGGAGKVYTESEKQAAQGAATLTESDPLPQTMIRCEAKPGDPLLVTVPIKIAAKPGN